MQRWFVAFFVLAGLGPALAQEPRGSIVGRITDTSRAVLPDATVQLTHQQTNVTTTVRSNNVGPYWKSWVQRPLQFQEGGMKWQEGYRFC